MDRWSDSIIDGVHAIYIAEVLTLHQRQCEVFLCVFLGSKDHMHGVSEEERSAFSVVCFLSFVLCVCLGSNRGVAVEAPGLKVVANLRTSQR